MTEPRQDQLPDQQDTVQDKKLFAAAVSIGVNLVLIAIKLLVALTTGSIGILAQAGDSMTDLVASGFAYWGIRLSSAPPDSTHHYGHERFENLSALIQVVLLIAICFYIFYEVYNRLMFGFSVEVTEAALAVLVVSLIADFLASRYLHRAARAYSSPALEANAYHFTTDLLTTSVVLLGLIAVRFGYAIVDPIAALGVAIVMIVTAIRLGRTATGVLVDASPGAEIEEEIRAILRDQIPGIDFHRLRLRQSGNNILLDLSLHVPNMMHVAEAHKLSHLISDTIQARMPNVREAVVHIEPAGHEEEEGEGIRPEELNDGQT
jgi:cation diffusion facilitator family transporter